MTFILSGFADEISQDLGEQLEVLAAEGITHLELRSVWSANVADLGDAEVARLRRELDDAGVRVSAIGSPVGKIAVDAPLGPELERLRRVCDVAESLGTTLVRVFSFFIPGGEPPERYREQVTDRMRALAGIAEERGVVLAHENEKEIYGDRPQRCAELIQAVGSPALRATFDAANFVQCGVRPQDEAYGLIRPYLVYLQIKDALARSGRPWPPCGTMDSAGTYRWSRIWPRRGALAASAGRTASAAPPGHSKSSSASCRSPGNSGRRPWQSIAISGARG
jgi:sugar phosphate isomerase/epimerase